MAAAFHTGQHMTHSTHSMICIQAGLVTGSYVGMGNNGTGCFTTGTGVTLGMELSQKL